jgi:hypothetical protein
MTDLKTPTRKASTPIVVRVNPDEKRAIEEMARTTGNSTSAYLRKIGLGYQVKSIVDYSKVDELAKVNADLGRLGGLLKLWLTSDKRLDRYDLSDQRRIILKTLESIEVNQDKIVEIMNTIVQT